MAYKPYFYLYSSIFSKYVFELKNVFEFFVVNYIVYNCLANKSKQHGWIDFIFISNKGYMTEISGEENIRRQISENIRNWTSFKYQNLILEDVRITFKNYKFIVYLNYVWPNEFENKYVCI